MIGTLTCKLDTNVPLVGGGNTFKKSFFYKKKTISIESARQYLEKEIEGTALTILSERTPMGVQRVPRIPSTTLKRWGRYPNPYSQICTLIREVD